jgi:CMP-N,N'-diacetyllegionaminic acid synthase
MVLAFIPAKGTSQRVPEKNLRKLGNRSLVQRSLDYADAISEITSVVLSTDSAKVVESCEPFKSLATSFQHLEDGKSLISGKWILHKRCSKDASAVSRTIDAVLDFLMSHATSEINFVLLQPTSPFRQIEEWEVISKLFHEKSSSIFSVHSVDSPHPEKSFQLLSNSRPDLDQQALSNLSSPAQILGQYFAPDGAFYFNKISQLIKTKSFIDLDSRVFIRKGLSTLNIDTEDDYEFAKYAANRFGI